MIVCQNITKLKLIWARALPVSIANFGWGEAFLHYHQKTFSVASTLHIVSFSLLAGKISQGLF